MYDAIVVGARCAGSPTAMLLARKGYKVLLLDRGTFPSDMPFSNHYVHQTGSQRLKRWGILDRLAATNCPPIRSNHFNYGAFSLAGAPVSAGGVEEAYAPRRLRLDPVLVEAAVEAGAELRDGFSVQELLWDGNRVAGIRGHRKGGALCDEKARITIGADGMFSMVAKAVQAPEFHNKPPLEGSWYAYWSGVPVEGWNLWLRPGRVIFSYPTNDGLSLIGVAFPARELAEVRKDIENHHGQTIASVAPELAERMRGGHRESHFVGGAIPGYVRKPYGPGWALVGDAGYQKDPCTASGITDAFSSADLLTEAIDAGFGGREPLERALARYEQTRNKTELPYYEMTSQFATLDAPPPPMQQLLAALQFDAVQRSRFFGVLAHTVAVEEFFSSDNMKKIVAGRSRSAVAAS